MQNINYPGEICLAFYHVIKHNPPLVFKLWRLALCFFTAFCALSVFFIGRAGQFSGNKKAFVKFIGNPKVFFAVLALGLFFFRFPNLIVPRLDGDESQYMATAASVSNGAVLWKDVGEANGPLNILPISGMKILGDGINYTTTRIFGLFCIILSIFFTWKTLAALFNNVLAAIIVIPLTISFAVLNVSSLLAYNAEHVPMLLVTICIWLLFTLQPCNSGSWKKLLLLGFILGLIPWSKTQAVFLGLVLGLLAMVEILGASGTGLKQKIKGLIILIASALLPTVLMFIFILKNNGFPAFWGDYVTGALLYSKVGLLREHYTGLQKLFLLFKILNDCHETSYYLGSSLLLLMFAVATGYKTNGLSNLFASRKLIFSSLILITAYATVIFPGNAFPHYLMLFIFPFAIWIGVCVGQLTQTQISIQDKKFFIPYLVTLLICLFPGLRTEPRGIYFVANGGDLKLSEVSKTIIKYARPNEKMSIWGWSPFYFIETGLVQGNYSAIMNPFYYTADSSNPHVEKYISDMANNKPVIFLDAVGPGSYYYEDTLSQRHEIYPLVAGFISKNYSLAKNINGKRVYVLNTRLIEMGYKKE